MKYLRYNKFVSYKNKGRRSMIVNYTLLHHPYPNPTPKQNPNHTLYNAIPDPNSNPNPNRNHYNLSFYQICICNK